MWPSESRYQPFGTSPSNPELPKKPLNAWGFFVKSELTGISVGGRNDVQIAMKGLSPKWKAMTEAEKAPYVSQQNKALDEYNKAIARIDPKVRKSKPVLSKPFHRTVQTVSF